MPPTSDNRLFSPVFALAIACTLFCYLFGQGANAGTSVYLECKGEPTTLAGIGAITMSLAAAVSRIATGPLSDAHGRQKAIIIGCAIMIVGSVGPIFENTGGFFIFWRILQGLGFSASTTALATAASDVLPLNRLGEGIGYYGLGQAISMSCGPAIAIALVYSDSPENFYIGLAVFSFAALACAAFIRYEKNPSKLPPTSEFRMRWSKGEVPYIHTEGEQKSPQASEKRAFERKDLSPIRRIVDGVFEPAALRGTIPMMLIATSFGFGIFFMGVYGSHLNVGNPGLFYTISAITMICVRLTSGKFMDKIRPIFIMGIAVLGGLVCYTCLLACSLLDDPSIIFYIAGTFYGISLGISLPINQTIAVKLSDSERWGAANGLYLCGSDLGIGFSSLIWSICIDSMGYPLTLICVMGCISASMLAAWICYPKEKV